MRLGISFAIVFLSWFFLAGTNGNDGDEPTTVPVLVAREFLSAGTRLKGSDFEEVGLPVELLPEGVAGFDIEGKVLSYPLQKGEVLFAKDLEGIQTEAKVMLTLQTDALGISQGDKIAVLVSSEEDTLTLADNLQVEEVRRNEYSDTSLILVGTTEKQAQAISLLKPSAVLTVVPSSGGLKVPADPLVAAKNFLKEENSSTRRVEVIEGGEVVWYDID